MTVGQSEFSHAVVEDYGICRPVWRMRPLLLRNGEPGKPRAEKSLADHLNGEYMTQICNFYPLPLVLVLIPTPSPSHFSILSLCQRHGSSIPFRAFQFLNFCLGESPENLFLLGIYLMAYRQKLMSVIKNIVVIRVGFLYARFVRVREITRRCLPISKHINDIRRFR